MESPLLRGVEHRRNASVDWQYFDTLLRANTTADIWAHCARFANDIGFDHYAFVAQGTDLEGSTAGFFAQHSYTGPWSGRFKRLADPKIARADPVVLHVLAQQPPTAWNCRGDVVHTRVDIRRRARKALTAGISDFGIRNGLTIPILGSNAQWSYMGLTASHSTDTTGALSFIAASHTFAHFLHASLRRLRDGSSRVRLTRREREVLQWAAVGKTSWEIGRILAIGESTVNFHIASAIRRLGVKGRLAAVARALAIGAITI